MPLFILQWSGPLCPSAAVPWVLHASTPIDGTGDREPGPYELLLCLLSRMLTSSTDGVGENVLWGHAAQNVVSWELCMGSYGKSTSIHTPIANAKIARSHRISLRTLDFFRVLILRGSSGSSLYFYWWAIALLTSNQTYA